MIPYYIIHHKNEKLKQEYITNRDHILADDDENDDIKNIHNFESNNLSGGYREIRSHIYRSHLLFLIRMEYNFSCIKLLEWTLFNRPEQVDHQQHGLLHL